MTIKREAQRHDILRLIATVENCGIIVQLRAISLGLGISSHDTLRHILKMADPDFDEGNPWTIVSAGAGQVGLTDYAREVVLPAVAEFHVFDKSEEQRWTDNTRLGIDSKGRETEVERAATSTGSTKHGKSNRAECKAVRQIDSGGDWVVEALKEGAAMICRRCGGARLKADYSGRHRVCNDCRAKKAREERRR